MTFSTFSQVDWGLALLLVTAAMFLPVSRLVLAGTVLAALIVAVEALWLLPVLNAMIAGTPLQPSPYHMLYAVTQRAKPLLLCSVALMSLYRLGWIS